MYAYMYTNKQSLFLWESMEICIPTLDSSGLTELMESALLTMRGEPSRSRAEERERERKRIQGKARNRRARKVDVIKACQLEY